MGGGCQLIPMASHGQDGLKFAWIHRPIHLPFPQVKYGSTVILMPLQPGEQGKLLFEREVKRILGLRESYVSRPPARVILSPQRFTRGRFSLSGRHAIFQFSMQGSLSSPYFVIPLPCLTPIESQDRLPLQGSGPGSRYGQHQARGPRHLRRGLLVRLPVGRQAPREPGSLRRRCQRQRAEWGIISAGRCDDDDDTDGSFSDPNARCG